MKLWEARIVLISLELVLTARNLRWSAAVVIVVIAQILDIHNMDVLDLALDWVRRVPMPVQPFAY
jgi:hypothetical protein